MRWSEPKQGLDKQVVVCLSAAAWALIRACHPVPTAAVTTLTTALGVVLEVRATQLVLPAIARVVVPHSPVVALVKPQFEAGREEVGKGGVVRDPAIRARVCDAVVAWLTDSGWTVAGVVESPITGPEGNVEYLVAASRIEPQTER